MDRISTDFSSIAIEVRIQNTTTSTEFTKPGQILLVELQERGVTLEVSPRCCAQGHHLLVEFEVFKAGKKISTFVTTAKVEEQVSLEANVDRIAITLVQFEEESWKTFRSAFTFRQDQINQFIKAARGW